MSENNHTGEETFRDLIEQTEVKHGKRERPPQPHGTRHPQPRPPTGAPATTKNIPAEFMRAGVQHKEMRRLKQGKFPLNDDRKIDLHGLKRDEAHQPLSEFIDHCLNNDIRYACVICGKGVHSPGKPVLRPAVRSWLSHHRKVLAYCPAQLKDGGDGALYVLLKTGHAGP